MTATVQMREGGRRADHRGDRSRGSVGGYPAAGRDTALQFVLYPMIHMAKPAFYAAVTARLKRADVVVAEGVGGCRRVPLAHRLLMWCVLPFVVVARLFGGTRMIWSRSMEQNDLPSPEQEDLADWSPTLEAAFGGERDDRLLAVLCRLHEERSGEDIEVAVVYGAAHVPAIVRGLMNRYGYRPHSADWLTIADV